MSSNAPSRDPGEVVRDLREQSQEAIRLGRQFGRATGDTVDDLALASRLQLERRPYVTLGATFGLGYVLGGGVPLRLLTLGVAFGGRIAASMALRQLTQSLLTTPSSAPAEDIPETVAD